MRKATYDEFNQKSKYLGTVQYKLTYGRMGLYEYEGEKYTVETGQFGLPVLNNGGVELNNYDSKNFLLV